MAQLRLDSALAGLIVPDPKITADTLVAPGVGASDSTHALGSPRPGRPTFDADLTSLAGTHGARGPNLALTLTGEQADDLTVRVQRGGMPGAGCEVIHAVADTDVSNGDYSIADGRRWYGWSTPNVIERISTTQIDKGIDDGQNFGWVEAEDGAIVCVYGNLGKLTARRFDPQALEWLATEVDIADDTFEMLEDGAIPTHATSACDVTRLSSGRLLCASFVQNNEYDYELVTHWSDDNGATWRAGTWNGVDRAIDPTVATVQGLRICYDPASEAILLLVTIEYDLGQGPVAGWVQYASDDLGASFVQIEDWSDGDSVDEPGPPAIIADPVGRGFVVLYTAETGITRNVFQRRIASPFYPLRDATETTTITVTPGANLPTTVTAFPDRQGRVWLGYAPLGTSVGMAYSDDGCETWAEVETPLYEPTTAGKVDRLHGVAFGCEGDGSRAGVLWALTDTTNATRADYRLPILSTGGWRTLCQPRVRGGYPYELQSWDVAWLPIYAPASYGWSNSGGTGSLSGTGAHGLTLTATPSTYGRNITATTAAGIIVQWEVSGFSGSAVTSLEHGLRIRIGSCELQVRMSGSTVRLYDVAAGAQVGTDFAANLNADRWVFRLAIRGGGTVYAALYAREATDPVWELATSGTLATTSASTDSVTWGVFAGAGTMTGTWHGIYYTLNGGSGSATAVTTSPAYATLLDKAADALPGAPLPGSAALPGLIDGGGLPVIGGGVLRGSGGPGRRGEVWTIPVGDQYPVEAAIERFPGSYLETANDDAQRIVWEPAGGTAHHPGGNAVGIAVFGANFGSAILQGWTGSAWEDVAELDLALTGLSYSREGNTIRPASGGTAYGWQNAGDLVGATINLGSGKIRKVAAATAGAWNAGNAACCSLQLEGVDGSEPTSGTAILWVQSGFAVALGAVTAYSRWGLYLPAQTTHSGKFQISAVRFGSFLPFGVRYSWGRVVGSVVEAEITDIPRAESGRLLGPPARRISVSWVEGVPTRRHLTAPAYQGGGGIPLVGAGDVSLAEALQATHGGRSGQVVYVPRVVHDPAAVDVEVVAMKGRDYAVLCCMDGEITTENIQGEEGGQEIVRLSGLTLIEEPT